MENDSPKQPEFPMPVDRLSPTKKSEHEEDYWLTRLKPKKTFQTLVSEGVPITRPELDIIDTPEFQRLRRVRQLGTSCIVYPTALHTRFDHSLGTLQMVEEMLQRIVRNEHSRPDQKSVTDRQRALARIYALVHDITHVPFGHTLEDELGILIRHDRNEKRIDHFLGPDSTIGKIIVRWFGKDFHTDLMRIYSWNEDISKWDGAPEDVFIHDLVSNTVCGDLLDYLRRDDRFCNLGVGMSYPFLNYLYLDREEKEAVGAGGKMRKFQATRLFVRLWKKEGQPRRDVLSDLCRLLDARYLVAERVYFHHAKVIAGAMLARAIQEAHDAKYISEENMWAHSDDTLVFELIKLGKKAPLASKLAQAYWDRRLYKCAFEFRAEDVDKTQAGDHNENWMREHIRARLGSAEKRRDFENHLADVLMLQPGDVLVYFPDEDMNMKQAEMRVLWKGNQIPFRGIDDPVAGPRLDAILKAHMRLWSIRVLVPSELDDAQRALLRELCELELFMPAEQAARGREDLYEKIVWRYIDIQKNQTPLPPGELHSKVKSAVKALCAPAKDTNRSFAVRVEAVIAEQFGGGSNSP